MNWRWPFVLRSTYDALVLQSTADAAALRVDVVVAHGERDRIRTQNEGLNARCLAAEGREEQWQALVAKSQEQSESWAARYDALLEKFTQLRLAGAVEPVRAPEKPVKDRLAAALDAHPAAKDPELRRRMRQQLDLDRVAIDAGMATEDDVLANIYHGVPTDGVP